MTSTGHAVTDQLLSAYRSGRALVLLFDYDGTLVPIVEHPRLARLPGETRRLLEQLAEQPRLFVGVLSGRAIDEIKGLVAISSLYYCGTSGLELDLRGAKLTPPSAEEQAAFIEDVARELGQVVASYPGAWLEKKPLGLTLHYRDVAAQEVADLLTGAEETLKRWTDGLRVLGGPMALEITPALGWSKGTAVRTIVDHAAPHSFPLYAGDEANDEDALEAAVALGGVAIGVGPTASRTARYHLPDPAALARFLQYFHESLESSRTS